MTGSVTCGCETGWMRTEEGRCEQAGRRGHCQRGDVIQQTDRPPGCDCRHWADCQTFLQDARRLTVTRERAGASQYRTGVERLASLVCDKQAEKVCCGQRQTLTAPLGATELVQILTNVYSRELSCQPNNCPTGQTPWPGRPGECFDIKTNVNTRGRSVSPKPDSRITSNHSLQDCRLVLTEAEDVVCEEQDEDGLLDLLSVRNVPGAFSSKCGRGRIWSRYRARCVGLFF